MSVIYEWDESNGVSVPTNKLMVINAETYYVGMPLKKVDAETVEPTDGTPDYICMAQRNAGDEIKPLQIPVQEVFPDAVYTKRTEDGNEEQVRFGGGGKIKPEQLPDGYPYETVKEFTVEHIPIEENWNETVFKDFPVFDIGDTVALKVDGVEYSLVAFNDGYGSAMIGDSWSDMDTASEKYGWSMYVSLNIGLPVFYSKHNHVVSWEGIAFVSIAPEFLPDGYPYEKRKIITVDSNPSENFFDATYLGGFPAFTLGDTVNVTVDGVKYSLVASNDSGIAVIGDMLWGSNGEYGWTVLSSDGTGVRFFSSEAHTVSWESVYISTMADKFFPATSKVIELVIDPEYSDTDYVYASSIKAHNKEPMKTIEFMNLIPEDGEGYLPFTVVLKNRAGGIRYTVVEVDTDNYDGLVAFYILDASGKGIPTRYTTESDYGGGES